MEEEQLIEIPKVELHCHLDGSVSLDFLENIYSRGREDLRREVMAPELCENLTEYLNCFPLLTRSLSTERSLIEAVLDLAVQAAKENVIYLEVRFSPYYVSNNNMSEQQAVQAVLRGIELAEAAYDITIGLILCMMRGKDNDSIYQLAYKYYENGVCALDLAGNEQKYGFPTSDINILKRAKKDGIPFTLHAGETGNLTNVLVAIQLGAKRIGHGIAAAKSKVVCEYLHHENICLELCPTCNIQTRASESWDRYPLDLFYSRNVRLSINTDNRTVTNTTLTKELSKVRKYFHLPTRRIVEFTEIALQSAFLSQGKKDSLQRKIEHKIQKIRRNGD